MDLRFGEHEEKLRAEVRAFLKANLKDEGDEGSTFMARDDGAFEEALEFNRKLGERGWIAPAWPKEYGGLGATIAEQMVFNEEFGYYGAPDTGTRGFGVGMIGPTLIVHGNEEQKKRSTCPASPAARSSGARATASPAPAATSPACRRAPCAMATTTSSTARRSGPPAATARTGCSCSRARTRTRPSTAASASSSSMT